MLHSEIAQGIAVIAGEHDEGFLFDPQVEGITKVFFPAERGEGVRVVIAQRDFKGAAGHG